MTTKRQKKKSSNSKAGQSSKKELTRLGSALRQLGHLAGSGIGSLVGAPAGGGSLGQSFGASLSKWLGSGDYRVATNSLAVMAGSSAIPNMHQNGQSTIIRHREFINTVKSGLGNPTSFTLTSYDINPGLERTFPWLSAIAQQYTQYSFRGLVFHYIPTSGASVASANTSLGSVMMATQYRSGEIPFTDKLEMMNDYYSNDARPDLAFAHPIECDPKENPLKVHYVRSGGLPPNEDQRFYDLGSFSTSTQGQQSQEQELGELWVTYEVVLSKPKSRAAKLVQSEYWHSKATGSTVLSPFGSVSHTPIFDTFIGPVDIKDKTITMTQVNPGKYLFLFHFATPVEYNVQNVTVVRGSRVSMNSALNDPELFLKGTITGGVGGAIHAITITPDSFGRLTLIFNLNNLTVIVGNSIVCDVYIFQVPSGAL